MQKVNFNENRQPKGVKMMNGIVSANNFHIFSESDDHFFLLNEVQFGIKTSNLIK